jgi:3-deoxy-D-manno-octulosonic-acid transferase
MGGSLVPHGGQNPLEPARLACAIATGPHTHNFADMMHDMEQAKLISRITSTANLAPTIDQLFNNTERKKTMQTSAKKWVETRSGAAERIMTYLEPLLQPRKSKS